MKKELIFYPDLLDGGKKIHDLFLCACHIHVSVQINAICRQTISKGNVFWNMFKSQNLL
jgi:hypothetical protein